MAHNIGQMFYFGNVPWHTLGNKLDHAANLNEALEAGGLDWTVTKVPIHRFLIGLPLYAKTDNPVTLVESLGSSTPGLSHCRTVKAP